MSERLNNLQKRVDAAIHSSNGRNLLLYLMFTAVAGAFWLFLSLDAEVQRDYDIPVSLTEVPDSVTVIADFPPSISVSVKGKGSQLLRYSWGKTPVMKIDFRSTGARKGRIHINRSRLDSRLRDYFGTGVTIVAMRPDTLVAQYTTLPGKPLPVKVVADVEANLQCIVNGPVRANVDSVLAYAVSGVPTDLTQAVTAPVKLTNLRDTTLVEVPLTPVKGVRFVPDHVTITVPVEPLIAKKREVSVDVVNVPVNERLLTFPSKIEVTYLVPMSAFNDEYPIRAYVDYIDTALPGDLVPVKISAVPANYHNTTFSPDSVEYLIERN